MRHGSVGSASACCKAGPSSILGSAPQGGFSQWTSDEEMERDLDEWRRINALYECDWMNVCKIWKINKKSGILPPETLNVCRSTGNISTCYTLNGHIILTLSLILNKIMIQKSKPLLTILCMHLKNFQLMCSILICFLLIWRVHPKNTQKALASICYKRSNDGDPICGQSEGFPVPTSWIITSWPLT